LEIAERIAADGSIIHNLSGLNASVTLLGLIGPDEEGKHLKRELRKMKISDKWIFTDKSYPTVTKTRIIAQHQQIVRIDREKSSVRIGKALQKKIFDAIAKNINDFDAIIVSDYGKGFITPELLEHVCNLAMQHKKIITVDPKVGHFQYYRNVTAISPNLKEAENAIRNIKITSQSSTKLNIHDDKLDTTKKVDLAGNEILKFLDLDSLLITMGEQGMRLFEKGKKPVHIKTQAREVFDVTGAGDAVISVFSLALTAGATKKQAAELSNFAAGVVVSKLGAASINKKELLASIKED